MPQCIILSCKKILLFFIVLSGLSACKGDFDEGDVKEVLQSNNVYPLVIEMNIYCNTEKAVQSVTEQGLVKKGFVTTKAKHSPEDIGKPLVEFTEKAQPYLIQTSDTMKSFDIQRVKVADETFVRVNKIEIGSSKDKAVVDYYTVIENTTPFVVLYNQDIKGEQPRRTFFTKQGDQWTWDGKVIKMLRQ